MIRLLAPGFLLTLAMGVGAYFLSSLHSAIDALVVAVLSGMLVRWAFGERSGFSVVVAYAKDLQEFLIPFGVLLYALTIDLQRSLHLPTNVYVALAATMVIFFVVAIAAASVLKVPTKTGWLTAIGSAICGASAICISSRAVDADDDDVSNSMIATMVVGLAAVALYESLPFFYSMESDAFGIFCGATLQQTGLVKTATASLDGSVQGLALSVKALRIALLPFVALVFFFIASHRSSGRRKTFLIVVFAAFVAIVLLSATMPAVVAFGKAKSVKVLATIVFAVALVNLGLLVDIRRTRLGPVVVAALAWMGAVATFLAMG